MKHTITILLIILSTLLFSSNIFSQNDSLDIAFVSDVKDTVDTVGLKKHSPKLATYLSLALPGAGQAYNGGLHYIKIPIIYGGFALLYAGYSFNNKYYKLFGDEYAYAVENFDPQGYYVEDVWFPDATALQAGRDQYRKSRDMMAIGMGILYILNIIDASVGAHFYNYDVNDDLSLRLEPTILNNVASENTIGIKLNVYF